MRLNLLRMENFRQHRDTTVEFDSGITGIIGPNGAGKSTILEAIAWGIYGNPAARGNREGIRYQRAQPRAQVVVELDFELSGHRYRVVRGLTTAELYLDGGAAPIANSISGVAEVVHRHLGMSRTEFFNTYFTGQKELNAMSAMKPAERGQFLSRVLGYEKLRAAQELVRDQRKVIAAEVTGFRSGMRESESIMRAVAEATAALSAAEKRLVELEAVRERAETHLAELTPRWEGAQEQRDRLQELLAELRVCENDLNNAQRESERIAREQAEVSGARTELASLGEALASYDAVVGEAQRYEVLARHDGRRRALQENGRALEEELQRLKERYARVESAPGQEEGVTEELERARSRLAQLEGELEAVRTDWVRDRQEAETRRQALRSQYAELRDQREKLLALGDGGNCPTCLRPLGESYRTVIDMLNSQMETVLVDGNYFKSRLEQLEDIPAAVQVLDEERRRVFQDVGSLERRLAQVQGAVHDRQQIAREVAAKESRVAVLRDELEAIPAGYDVAVHDTVRAEVERLAPLRARAAHLELLMGREEQLRVAGDEVRSALDAKRLELEGLRVRREGIDFKEAEYIALRTAHEYAASELHQAEVAVASAQGEVSAAQGVLAAALKEREELRVAQLKVEALQLQRRLHDELDRAFTDLRTDLNFQLRPELSELASGFLRDLTDGRFTEMELDDSYRIVVLEDGIPKPVISGGEEDLANLSLRLAVSQLIAERSGHAFSLLVLDEVFGSLDESHRRGVVELLRRVRDRFEQVILITHIESVKEGLDRVLEVSFDEESGSAVVERSYDTPVPGYAGGDGGEGVSYASGVQGAQ